jgi:hypothetical protein
MNKYEKLIEYIVNDEQDKAKALFHEIVVEKSRDIYESLIDDEEQGVGGDQVEDMVDEITSDEVGMHEAEDEDELGAEMGGDNMDNMDNMGGDDMDNMDNMGGDDMGGEGAIEDRVLDLEDALDELKAEFDRLMSDEESEAEHNDGENDPEFDSEGDDADNMGSDEEEEAFAESRTRTEAERIREYVEKVSDQGQKSEGGEVGKGGSASVNKQSTVAGKNNMGGTASNLVKGGSEANPDGTSPKGAVKAKGEFTGTYQNKPGAKADMSKAPAAKKGEEGGVNDKSPLAK